MTATRRRALLALPFAGLLRDAHAGAQVEEPLADAVRGALTASVGDVAPPRPRFERIEDPSQRAPEAPQGRTPDAHRIPRNGLVRKPARRA